MKKQDRWSTCNITVRRFRINIVTV